MKTERNFKIGQIVWYMDHQWAHVGKIQRKRTTVSEQSEQVDYEINTNWIPDCYVFATKAELRSSIIHYIDNNSPKDYENSTTTLR